MARKHTKVEGLAGIVKERHDRGETHGEIAASMGLEKRHKGVQGVAADRHLASDQQRRDALLLDQAAQGVQRTCCWSRRRRR